jgi:hypothetical protein
MAARRCIETVLALLCTVLPHAVRADNAKLEFWDRQRRGANCQNLRVTPQYWQAARAAGIEYIRLVPDGWRPTRRDFLIGDADDFATLDSTDVATLRGVLDDASAAGVPVVLTMFSLPGARWRQRNGDRDDVRLWKEPRFQEQAAAFWRQLAAALADHPAIVAYNPLNEPHPERAFGIFEENDPRFDAWHRGAKGTPADLDAFNRRLVEAIRDSDVRTPILLDGWFYASPFGLARLEPLEDAAVLYAFHVYRPWDYTTFRVNRGRYVYPTRMPPGWTSGELDSIAATVTAWARRHGVPTTRIVAAEFGVDRRVGGATQYLQDVVTWLDRHHWHWAFYAYRDDGDWGGLDYELGTAPLGAAYWQAVEQGTDPETLKRRGPNPLWDVLARQLRPAGRVRRIVHSRR